MKHKYTNIRLALTLAAALAGIPAAQAGTEQAVRTYDTSALHSEGVTAEGVQYTRLSWEGLEMTASPGEPELPVEYVRFLVPVYTANFTATVSGVTHGSALQTMYRIYPGQEPVTTNHEGPVPFTAPLESAYTLTLPVRAEVVSDGFVDGCNHIVTVAVYPTAYSPANGTVMPASRLTVTLSYDDCTAADLKDTPIFPPHRSRHINVGDMVVNAQRMSSRQYAPAAAPLDTMSDRYYIITPRSLADSFRDLAAWKRQKGYDVVIKTIEDIYADSRYAIGGTFTVGGREESIVDSAASLRAYLAGQFQEYGSYFCLLAGDYRTPMPIRKVYSSTRTNAETFEYYSNYNGENFIPTDNYFSDFTSAWTLGSYMECDYKTTHYSSCKYNPDIAIGRLLCSKPEEVRNYFYKLKIYEAYPGRGNDDYLSKAFYFEEGKYEDGDSNGSMLGEANIVMAKFNPFESTVVLKDSCSYGGESLPHKGNDVINNMRRVGFSSLHGHGSPATIECCYSNGQFIVPLDWYNNAETALDDWSDRNRVAGRGFDNLDNKDFPSIAYSISCITAPFDEYEYGIRVKDPENERRTIDYLNGGHVFDMPYNFGSSFTVAGDFGGPAYLANTRSGLVTSSAYLEAKWGNLILNNPKMGIAEARSKFLNGSYLGVTHHLIGEPEFEMWINKPSRMETEVESTDYSVHITSNELAGATVCLFDGNGKRVLRNISGTDISLKLISLSHYTLSVWKPGFLPFIRFYGAHGTLSDFDEKFIVLDAEIGEQYTGTLPAGRAFCVGSNAKLTIEAMKAVNVNRSCIIEEGGVVTIAGDDKVTLNCTVKKGGKLKVTAKSIQMGSGFTIEPGGTLDIQYK